jgi:sRNA-binding carbon storage regulator CsrA
MAGLVLTRTVNERVRIKTPTGEMWITVTRMGRGQVRLVFEGPLDFVVVREERVPEGERLARKGEGQ